MGNNPVICCPDRIEGIAGDFGGAFQAVCDRGRDVGVLYLAVEERLHRKLVRSDLPTDNDAYQSLDHFDPKTGEPVAQKPVSRTEAKQRRRSRLGRKIEETVKKTVSPEKREEKAAEEPCAAETPVSDDEGGSGHS